MEYIDENGTKIIVAGNKVQYGEGKMRENVIGANYTHGIRHGGYLSSFNGTFHNELIGIESGIGDIINAKIGNVKEAYELLKTKISTIDTTDIFELSNKVLETVDEYFGGIKNIDQRLNYYYSEDYEESKDNKISNLKGTGAAMCVERAALSQNLLKSVGINSFFKNSGILKNGQQEIHSYNLIEYNNKFYIFDTSIPNMLNNQITPLIAEIDKETFHLLSAPITDIGISTTVSHYNPYRDTDVTITYDSNRPKHIEVDALEQTKHKNL